MNLNELSHEIKNSLLKQRVSLPYSTIDRVIREAIEIISLNLEKGNSVSLPKFGVFKTITRAPRTGRNPKTNSPVYIPEKRIPTFLSSDVLKNRIKGSETNNEY